MLAARLRVSVPRAVQLWPAPELQLRALECRQDRVLTLRRGMACTANKASAARRLSELNFDACFTRELPADPSRENVTRQVSGAFFSYVTPTPPDGDGPPVLLAASASTAALLGLDAGAFEAEEFSRVLAGATPLLAASGEPVASFAACYGGHQFGSWAGQLGDGRAISVAEVRGATGELWELQLKGAGETPYSRRGDGRAVLRSSIREYAASEAFQALGVPSTRALSLVQTNAAVVRDLFYNGNAKLEMGAVVCRVARSFVRFGTFQLPSSRGEDALCGTLTDFVIRHHYPGHSRASFLAEVVERTARLVAAWQSIGFVHGVLNTDNCSILCETIDYGPYGWMEVYDPTFTPNTTDLPGRRYCYASQPAAMHWNCAQLANALLRAGLVTQEEAQAGVDAFPRALKEAYSARFAAKLGLRVHSETLLRELMELMATDRTDFTRTFRWLAQVPSSAAPGEATVDQLLAPLAAVLPATMLAERRQAWAAWVRDYRAALAAEARPEAERAEEQRLACPLYVPRNYLLQEAIAAAERGDTQPLHALLKVLRNPYTEQEGAEKYAEQAPEWALTTPGVCVLSCSS